MSRFPYVAVLCLITAAILGLGSISLAHATDSGIAATLRCDPAARYAGCHLVVAVSSFVKDINGNFRAQSTFSDGDCFYVNAVVVNDGNSIAVAPVNARIDLPSGISLDPNEAETKTFPGSANEPGGNLTPGREADFWWKVCCTAANGWSTLVVNATAGADGQPQCESYGSTRICQQECPENSTKPTAPPGLEVEIIRPTPITDCAAILQLTKQPIGDCSAQNFTMNATVTNTGDSEVDLIYAVVSVSVANWMQLPNPPIFGPFSLGPNGSHDVQFNMVCIGTGLGNITVTAAGTDSATSQTISGDDFITLDQKALTAQVTPDPAYAPPTKVNKCQDFNLVFRYFNYSGVAWNDPATGSITACIKWKGIYDPIARTTGNATLIDSVYYRRIPGFNVPPGAWQLLTDSPVTTGPDADGYYTSCVHIPVICACCGAEVEWDFQCTDVGEVQFYSTLTVQQTSPVVFSDSDTSETVCVDQVWKSHLIADNFFFIQDSYGVMVMQDAVVPGTYFHVVIPVINTGDADAQNVQVYFTVVDDPTGDCIKSYTFVSSSGDGTVSFNAQTGVGIASLGDIPGHSVKKAILLVHCLCEGRVTVWIPDAVTAWGNLKGIRALDANTQEAVPQANIVVPPYPEVLEQIPFTVAAVATDDATSIWQTSAALNGHLSNLGSASSVSLCFEYGADTTYGNTTATDTRTTTGSFSAQVTGLLPGTTYHFKANAVSGDKTTSGGDMTFVTTGPPIQQVISALKETSSSVAQEESKGFNVSTAENLLTQAEQAFENEDYQAAYELASKAKSLALDIDQDGVPNSSDFAPTIKNIYIYAGASAFSFMLIVSSSSVLTLRWRRKRIEKHHIEKQKAEIIGMIEKALKGKREDENG